MRDFVVGQTHYRAVGSDCEVALAHAIGLAFIELQQLEFSIISYLEVLGAGTISSNDSFDLFASKTFGNLLRELRKHEFFQGLVTDMRQVKEKRDFFIHKFLFHRYGGKLFTTDGEYENLLNEALDLGALFAKSHTDFVDLILTKAPIEMFAAKIDPETGEMLVVESNLLRQRQGKDD